MLVVEAGVYNLNFGRLKDITFENVEILVRPDFQNIRDKVQRSQNNIRTGTVKVNIPNTLTADESIQYSRIMLRNFEVLLSFAQNRDIFFHEFECFEIHNCIKKSVLKKRRSIRIGKKKPIPIIRHRGLVDFVKTGIPLLRNDDYNNETGLRRALDFWVESCLFTPTVIEVDHALNFSALEVLANAHVNSNQKTFLFSEQKWDVINERSKQLFSDLGINGDPRSRLIGSLMFPKQGSIKQKIIYLLESLGLPRYELELSQIINLRHDILHGKNIKENYKDDDSIEVVLKCRRLLEKIILNHLKFYHRSDVIHGSHIREDLRARI